MAARVRDVVWAESARDALDAVIGYIAQDSQQAAVQVLDEALRAGANLATFAERGCVVPELNDPAIREVFVYKYRLQYEVGEARVLIVAFLHGARATSAPGGRASTGSSRRCITNEEGPATDEPVANCASHGRSTDFVPNASTARSSAIIDVVWLPNTIYETAIVAFGNERDAG